MPKGDGQIRTGRRGRPIDPPRQRDLNPSPPASSFKPTIQLKACPRCSGDLSIDRDIYGVEISCLQCGYRQEDQARIAEEVARLSKLHRANERRAINGVRM